MDARILPSLTDEYDSFLVQFRHTFSECEEATRIKTATAESIRASETARDAALERQKTLRARDPRSLSMSRILEAIVLLILMGGEAFVNYLAAEGLLQDQEVTIGVTIFLTLVVGFIAFGLAREDRARRREEREGKPATLNWAAIVLLASTGAYLVLSLLLRQRYFEVKDVFDNQGSFITNPWLVASALTVLAAIGIAASAYVLSHVDNELAAAKREVRQLEARIRKLETAKVAADDRLLDAKQRLAQGADRSANNVVRRLAADPVGADISFEAADEIHEYFSSRWKRRVGERVPVPAPPAGTSLQDPFATPSTNGAEPHAAPAPPAAGGPERQPMER
jgi:hypothetical protein